MTMMVIILFIKKKNTQTFGILRQYLLFKYTATLAFFFFNIHLHKLTPE